MRFNKISFENYRCFLNGSIDFEKSPEKNMTILIAPNGGGKLKHYLLSGGHYTITIFQN